jgi:AcrR family transcriptional regulator
MVITQGQLSSAEERRAREGNADTRSQIFGVTEALLERVPLGDLSVAQIIEQAEISRATFYFYFSSKFDVVVGLLTNIMNDVYNVARPFIERADDEPPDEALLRGLEAAAGLWRTHRFALRAVSEHWNAVPELRTLWLAVVDRFTDGISGEIDRQPRADDGAVVGDGALVVRCRTRRWLGLALRGGGGAGAVRALARRDLRRGRADCLGLRGR